MEGPIFGGAYVRREICVIKSVGLACSGKEIYHFCFVLLYSRANSKYKPPRGGGGLYSEGRFNGGSFALRFCGGYIWRGFFSEFYGSSNSGTTLHGGMGEEIRYFPLLKSESPFRAKYLN